MRSSTPLKILWKLDWLHQLLFLIGPGLQPFFNPPISPGHMEFLRRSGMHLVPPFRFFFWSTCYLPQEGCSFCSHCVWDCQYSLGRHCPQDFLCLRIYGQHHCDIHAFAGWSCHRGGVDRHEQEAHVLPYSLGSNSLHSRWRSQGYFHCIILAHCNYFCCSYYHDHNGISRSIVPTRFTIILMPQFLITKRNVRRSIQLMQQ